MGHRTLVALIAAILAAAVSARAAEDFAGRYAVASVPPNGVLADAIYGGAVEMTARRRGGVYGVSWQLVLGHTRRTRGIGLADADGTLLGVSLATGGPAYGVAIYRHDAASRAWQGRWITSLDGGGALGEIRFDDNGGGLLPGRHRLVCRRPGSGGFEGAVDIAPRGDGDFLLTFSTGGRTLYRGVGAVVGEGGRLVVAWSFGSAPALAFYQRDAAGLLTGRRASSPETLAREGEQAERLLPVMARRPADPALVPGSPRVKDWNYDDLMARYGAEGWADRWLAEQLTAEERRRLNRALARPHDRRTIGELAAPPGGGKSRPRVR